MSLALWASIGQQYRCDQYRGFSIDQGGACTCSGVVKLVPIIAPPNRVFGRDMVLQSFLLSMV
jgi:hypothetical protein